MQAAAAEKRRHARIPVPPDTLVDSEYRAINLSESGIQVWSASHLDEGATLELVLQLDDMRVTGSGAVRWSRSAATVGDSGYRSGIEFTSSAGLFTLAVGLYVSMRHPAR